ncbi:MAG: hypothetical protein NTU79_23870 [Planctomycetota bacterium]|nr:hypothetical protein [Planctomycetota bacterium]
MSNQAYRLPTWLEQSAKAPGVDPQAVEMHNRQNGALERGDATPRLLALPNMTDHSSVLLGPSAQVRRSLTLSCKFN